MLRIYAFFLLLCAMPGLSWAQPPSSLAMGFIPSRSISEIQVSADRIADYLANEVGIPVETVTVSNYAGVALAMQSKRIDLAFVGPMNYLKINDMMGAYPITSSVRSDQQGYRGLVITRSDSEIKSLNDLRGKTMGFADALSTSGSLYPKQALRKVGVDPDSEMRSVMLSSHSSIAMSVLRGKVDAGAIYQDARTNPEILSAVPDVLERTRVIYTTDLIPADPQIVRKDLPKDIVNSLREALIKMSADPEAQKWLKDLYGIDSIAIASDEDYNKLREVIIQADPDFLKRR
ncbi:phosphate/phosphite/phosphonate ABC transporter substrate-binding protein [Marinobacter daepoensis]|uniref:Phosphate/phosphite/phosphonate ABC transporter substrate-binding protein n=1 Tax=Marinobacter daepoensis TaxID=262077 RepID=A0ABS3BHB2_9GAMM|nr:phosphate/phosphite/phosphonate ABC transporter substrate-binding protein [Marinobacter daepoensis]MBN7770127.1 phosphate/phosphite/phosphonate ABC transporter substrate-binding protein [Marinobacter daepoensis]MBY6079573.1 phosphate/phosphite/phosphonate ABC transporter substrate-binding protein [Marinobacter daepoensis]